MRDRPEPVSQAPQSPASLCRPDVTSWASGGGAVESRESDVWYGADVGGETF